MEPGKSYCEFVKTLDQSNLHRIYHDQAYGFPIEDDNELFGRLILEINQAGLNWEIILKKQDHFRNAFHQFNIRTVANYKEKDRERLLQDAGIIRNRLKIDATIENAKTILNLQKEYGSFKNWLDHHHPKTISEWVILFKQNFKFTGYEIVNEFLMSIGYLPGSHIESCSIYKKIIKAQPAWKNK